eukprot:gene22958-31264_t
MNTYPATLLNSARLSRGKYVLRSNFINMIKCFFTDHSDEKRNSSDLKSGPTIKINWRIRDGSLVVSHAKVGDVLLRVAQSHGVELEGACEGVCACSTCHTILEDSLYGTLPEPTEIEEDMLDLAFGLTPTSRLSCQLKVDESFEGATFSLPKATRNFYVDGHVPKPH